MSHLQRPWPGGNCIEMNGREKKSKKNSEKKREKEMPARVTIMKLSKRGTHLRKCN